MTKKTAAEPQPFPADGLVNIKQVLAFMNVGPCTETRSLNGGSRGEPMRVHLDSFSGAASDLKRGQRSSENVLAVLANRPRVSTWDMSEHDWLRSCIKDLRKRGLIVAETEPYQWHRYSLTEAGRLMVVPAAVGTRLEPERATVGATVACEVRNPTPGTLAMTLETQAAWARKPHDVMAASSAS